MPDHYKQGAILVEPIVVCSRMSFCLGNFVKYVCRAPYKGTKLEDYKKALWYINYIDSDTFHKEINELQKDKVLCDILASGPAILKNLLINRREHECDIQFLIQDALNESIYDLTVFKDNEPQPRKRN